MYNMPFFGFPDYRNYYSNRYYHIPSSNIQNNHNQERITPDTKNDLEKSTNLEKSSTTSDNSSSTASNNSRDINNNQAFISILGIDLYSDDILILCILLSLYLEGVKDEMLFICLILLLLS